MKAGSEQHFQQQVENLAQYYGWRIYHTHDSRRSHPGFPDLVLVRPPEIVFAELKTDKGRVRPDQADWIADLETVAASFAAFTAAAADIPHLERFVQAHGAPAMDVYIWRPVDFEVILSRLAAGRNLVRPDYLAEAAS